MRIIYFDIDCLRPDHLGCYGYHRPTSPNIDKLAEGGIRFEHYYCSSSPCLPSRAACFSGRFGIHNGIISNHGAGAQFHIEKTLYGGPKEDNEMFPRQLRRYGYDTISFSNFADRHCAMWFTCGWSEFHTPNLKGGWETGDEVNEKVLKWLEHNATRENYFLHINYWDTHRCYKMDSSWADRFADYPVEQNWPDEKTISRQQKLKGPFTAREQFKDNKSPFALMPGAVTNREDFAKMLAGYDASIAYADAHVGEVLAELERQGVLNDAIIIVSSDHGDAFGEHGIYSDHVCADECLHRIPLIIRDPRPGIKGKVSKSFMYNTDLAPTLCDLLGMPIPRKWDGKSYLENINGNDTVDREFLVWDTGLYTIQRAVRTKTHLYIKTYDSFQYDNMPPQQLFNMAADPYQTENLVESQPEIVEQCENILKTWQEEQMGQEKALAKDPLDLILEERKISLKVMV